MASKNKEKFILLLIFFFIIITITSFFLLTYKKYPSSSLLPITKGKALQVIPNQNPPYEIVRPSKNEIKLAVENADQDINDELFIPKDKIVDFIYPIFYPPNGYQYDKITVFIADYPRPEDKCESEFCEKSKKYSDIKNGYKTMYAHIKGYYGNTQDKFTLGLTYSLSPNKNEIPKISLNSMPVNVSSSLASRLNKELELIQDVKNFKDRYSISSGTPYFYRYSDKINSEYPYEHIIKEADLSPQKNWIIVRFFEPIAIGNKKVLNVFINPVNYQFIKTTTS